jgi:hypothetical protein
LAKIFGQRVKNSNTTKIIQGTNFSSAHMGPVEPGLGEIIARVLIFIGNPIPDSVGPVDVCPPN